jgi:HSP20 family protein
VVRIVGQIRAELDRILEEEPGLRGGLAEAPGVIPRVDIAQSDSGLCLLVEVPGTEAKDLEVQIESNVLTVFGNKNPAGPPARGARFLLVERQWGRFERSVKLPSKVNPKQGRALLEHGILRIDFPLLSEQRNQTHRLEIEAGGKVE